jgi:hypothetical protein
MKNDSPRLKMQMSYNMKAKTYVILSHAIESGCRYGVSRAFKHTEDPSMDEIEHQVHMAVMAAISEMFSFDDDEQGD